MTEFIAPDGVTAPVEAPDVELTSLLSPRELGILRLAARGCDNDAIAAELFLSVRTVERHLQNAYAKLGLQGRSAAIASLSHPRAARRRMSSSRGDNNEANSTSASAAGAVTRSGATNSVTSRRNTRHAGSSASTMWLLLGNGTRRAPRMFAASFRLCWNSCI